MSEWKGYTHSAPSKIPVYVQRAVEDTEDFKRVGLADQVCDAAVPVHEDADFASRLLSVDIARPGELGE